MTRVLVLVEGQTEERFIKDVLTPHFEPRNIFTIPKIITTKRIKRGPDFKGGITDYNKVETELRLLLGDTNASYVTTFVDYYGLPAEFPGIATRPVGGSPYERAQHVEKEWESQINHRRFKPFVMIHEFEALLFSKPDELSKTLHKPALLENLNSIRQGFPTPEEINDDPRTAPSKRIIDLFPGYQKTIYGPLVTKRIGLPTLRNECPHFNEWLTWLEAV